MQRFFVDPTCIEGDSVHMRDANQIHQINRVMRLREGEEIIVLDNTGAEYACRVASLCPREIEAHITERRINEVEPKIDVTLFQALPKKIELFEWVLQKGTELGAKQFFPLITERTERREFKNRARLERILVEAGEQSGRGKIPVLGEPVNFETLAPPMGAAMLHTGPCETSFSDVVSRMKGSVSIFVGPEGGFTEAEVERSRSCGVSMCSLGPMTLRTETAAIAALSCILLR